MAQERYDRCLRNGPNVIPRSYDISRDRAALVYELGTTVTGAHLKHTYLDEGVYHLRGGHISPNHSGIIQWHLELSHPSVRCAL